MNLLTRLTSVLSVTPVCPGCKQVIASQDVNIAQDIAFCRTCNLSHGLSTLTFGTPLDEQVDVSRRPAGTLMTLLSVWYWRVAGDGATGGAGEPAASWRFSTLVRPE
jgi:hypothetical protein